MDVSKYRNVSLLNIEGYSKQFIDSSTKVIKSDYELEAMVSDMDEFDRIATLDGIPSINTAEEIALLSATSGIINIRPVEAAKMLPADDPVLIDLQLGRASYMNMQMARFLGSDPAPHAAAFKFITDRGRVTEAEIKDFVKQGIAATVDKYYNQCELYNITPSLVYAEWKQNGVSRGLDGLQIVKDKLTAFYLSPTKENFAALRGIGASYYEMADNHGDRFAYVARSAFFQSLRELSNPLWEAVVDDKRTATVAIADAGAAGSDLGIFSLPLATGGWQY
jgi:hypothetical protein